MNKKGTWYWISMVVGLIIYSALVFGALCVGLRSCVAETMDARTLVYPTVEVKIEPIGPRVFEDAGIDIQRPVIKEEPVKLYTDDDAVVLAKTVWGEARGVPDYAVTTECQWAAVVWTILNRYDAGYADTIAGVASAPKQFHGYKESYPVDENILELVYDVLDRWNAEKFGKEDVGRVLPAGYLWFGGDGKHNHFRNEYRGGHRWDWSLGDPYAI